MNLLPCCFCGAGPEMQVLHRVCVSCGAPFEEGDDGVWTARWPEVCDTACEGAEHWLTCAPCARRAQETAVRQFLNPEIPW